MMKTSVLRQARFCRAALNAVSRVQIMSRPSPSSSALSSLPRALAAPCRSTSSPLIRLYSSEADAPSGEHQPRFVTKFADLASLGVSDALVRAITQGMRYENMTVVQSKTINAALDGKDLVAQAKTGTGKTLAFLVPLIQRILNKEPGLDGPGRSGRPRSDNIRAIIISPTRELAEQIAEEAKRLVGNTDIKVQCAVGGTQKNSMLRKTQREGCHILVATPGRLLDVLSDPSARIAAPNLEALVLDEADRMLETGFARELEGILELLPSRNDVPRQTMLFSATIPRNVIDLARQYINEENFEFVQTIDPNEVQTHEKVPQHIVPCRGFENLIPTLLELIQRENDKERADPTAMPFKAIVFLQTTASVVLIKSLFRRLAYHDPSLPRVLDIHSKLTQAARSQAADDFRRSKSAILFSSDVTARGMDFPNVSHVIQVHLPRDREQYIHRVGRTGRAGKGGEAYILVADMEVPVARSRLRGLPVQPCRDLECASVDATEFGAELPEQFQTVRAAMERIPEMVMGEMYRSLLGGALAGHDNRDIVHNVNNLARITFGLKELPAVSPAVASQVGGNGLRVVGRASGHNHGGGRGHDGGDRFERAFRGGSNDRGWGDRRFNGSGRRDDFNRGSRDFRVAF